MQRSKNFTRICLKPFHKAMQYLLLFSSIFFSVSIMAGTMTLGGLPAAPDEDFPVCYDQTTGAIGNCDVSLYGSKDRIAWVAKNGTGDYDDPISAMNDVNSWCPSRFANSRCLLRIAPGLYNLGTQSLVMANYVDIQGSGQDTTVIRGSRTSFGTSSGVVNGAAATISSLSIWARTEATASFSYITGVYNASQGFVMRDVTINALGSATGSPTGIVYGVNARDGVMDIFDSNISASRADSVRALYSRESIIRVRRSFIAGTSANNSERTLLTNTDGLVILTHSRLLGGDISLGAGTRFEMKATDTLGIVVIGSGTATCRATMTSTGFLTTSCP